MSERSGFRFSLRNLKATTGMMQTTVVSTMVSHTVGWARVFWALPGNAEESEALGVTKKTEGQPPEFPISISGSSTFPVSKLKSSLASPYLLPKCVSPKFD